MTKLGTEEFYHGGTRTLCRPLSRNKIITTFSVDRVMSLTIKFYVFLIGDLISPGVKSPLPARIFGIKADTRWQDGNNSDMAITAATILLATLVALSQTKSFNVSS